MFSLLVAIIYLAFISLGLPDSLLGSAWPVMHLDIGASVSSAGIISMTISVCTIISALFSDKLVKKLGTGVVTAISVFLTASAMTAFSFSNAFWQLCLFAVPYGLGAGAIDSCLNNYVAMNLSSRHMSWLHCCWGIGATLSPYIMSYALSGESSWHGGYRITSAIQFILAFVMFMAIPLWKKNAKNISENNENGEAVSLSFKQIFRLPGVIQMFAGFFFYCTLEVIPIVWASTYFSQVYTLSSEKAASFASLFYIGMTVSRAGCGFIADRLTDKQLIRYGSVLVAASALLIAVPFGSYLPSVIGFILLGIGCGPVYPSIVHSTPDNFGRKYSGSVIGVQMAFAYLGMTCSPILFGKFAELTTIKILPFCILVFSVLVLIFTEWMNKKVGMTNNTNVKEI